jgi:hypothetical protein
MPQPRGSFTGGIWGDRFVLFPGIPSAKLEKDCQVLMFNASTGEITNAVAVKMQAEAQIVFLFSDRSGVYLLYSGGGSSPEFRICHLQPDTGAMAFCGTAARVCRLVTGAAYDPVNSTVYVMGLQSTGSPSAPLEKARLVWDAAAKSSDL